MSTPVTPAVPRPVSKVGLWKPPVRQTTSARSFAPAAAESQADVRLRSARLLPEHFDDPAISALFAAARDTALVAEGDSWFDYPVPFRIDLLDALEDLGRPVISLAYRGDTLENMVYGTEGTDGNLVAPDLDRLVRMVQEIRPKAVLFSAGGNDVAGNEFPGFLNHILSGRPPLRIDYLKYVVREYARAAYTRASEAVWAVNAETKFITHGYANALPTGEGIGNLFGQIRLIGPWLKPALDEKGYPFATGVALVREVLGEFNDMLQERSVSDPRFVYVDFRPHVGNVVEDWANELHLTNAGIRTAARVLNDAISAAIGSP